MLSSCFRILALVAAMIGFASVAEAAGQTFTADAIQSHPSGASQKGRLFVSDMGVRFESGSGPLRIVRIVLPKEDVTRVLYPRDKVYMEYPGAAALPTDSPTQPCPKAPGVACEKVGLDTLNGIKTEKWRIAPQGVPKAMMVWWSPAHRMAVRQEFPNGRLMEMAMRGTESYEDRTVERWETSYVFPNGRAQRTVKLYDPALGLAVSETLPNGMSRRLTNIQLTKADPVWYAIPKDFKRAEAPQDRNPGGQPEPEIKGKGQP